MRILTTTAVTIALFTGPGVLAAQQVASNTGPDYETQISSGRVELEVRPEWRDGRLLIHLKADTHSVSLASVDLMRSVKLMVDRIGYEPVEAGSLSGHHGQATVAFAVPEQPEAFRLWILDVPDVPVRELRWPARP